MELRSDRVLNGIVITVHKRDLRLAGRVRDTTGGPIEGAFVAAAGAGRAYTAFAVSDEDGRFAIFVDTPSTRLSASADGYSARALEVTAPNDELVLDLVPQSKIAGVVVSELDSKPVANVEVRALEIASYRRRGPRSDAKTSSDEATSKSPRRPAEE